MIKEQNLIFLNLILIIRVMIMSIKKQNANKKYIISTKKSLLDRQKVWLLLKNCFWSKNIPIEYVERFIKYSLCFGVYQLPEKLFVGFGRVISDYTTYAYICDVIVDPLHRRKGVGNALIQTILKHKKLQGLKTWALKATPESQKIYKKNNFKYINPTALYLEIDDLSIYSQSNFVNLHQK